MPIALAVLIAVAITLAIAVPLTSKTVIRRREEADKATIGNAEEKARKIVDDALKLSETKKREALVEAKEESLRIKNESEREAREGRNPRTGETIKIAAVKAPKFKAGSALKDALN